MTKKYIIKSNCCFATMEEWESHCPDCKEGCGKIKLYEDGREEEL